MFNEMPLVLVYSAFYVYLSKINKAHSFPRWRWRHHTASHDLSAFHDSPKDLHQYCIYKSLASSNTPYRAHTLFLFRDLYFCRCSRLQWLLICFGSRWRFLLPVKILSKRIPVGCDKSHVFLLYSGVDLEDFLVTSCVLLGLFFGFVVHFPLHYVVVLLLRLLFGIAVMK